MTDQQMLVNFSRVLGDLLGNDSIALAMETRRGDVPEWDSFTYITFISAVEMELGIRFRVAAVESFGTVGDIVTDAQSLLARKK